MMERVSRNIRERPANLRGRRDPGDQMTSLLDLTANRPSRKLSAGEILLAQGDSGGDLFILLSGALEVQRDGVSIARLDMPGTIVGEMSVLLGIKSSATVSAALDSTVRVIRDAVALMDSEPALARRIAALLAGRLDATSAVVVELSRQKADQRVLTKLWTALAGR